MQTQTTAAHTQGMAAGKAWKETPEDQRDYSVTRSATRAAYDQAPIRCLSDFYRGFIEGAGYEMDSHGVVTKIV